MTQGNLHNKSNNFLDDPYIILFLLIGTVFVLWAIWAFARDYIIGAYVYVRYVEFWILYAIGSVIELPGVIEVKNWVDEYCQPNGLFSTCHRDFESVNGSMLISSSVWVNLFIFPFLCWYLFKAYRYLKKKHPLIHFRKIHSLDSFIKESEALYPHLKVFNHVDFINKTIDAREDPQFGMSLTSSQFIMVHRLIAGWQQEDDGSLTPMLDRKKAFQVFTEQLGQPYKGIKNLGISELLLCAITFPRVAATNPALNDDEFKAVMKESDDVIDWCWKQFVPPPIAKKEKGQGKEEDTDFAWLKPDIDLTYPRKIVLKYLKVSQVAEIINKHAYVQTMLYGLFYQARRLGVLPPAEMRWLKLFDRKVWYVLQSIGRQSTFPEGAASLSHYLYEVKTGEAIIEPQLDKAVDALEKAADSYKYTSKDKANYEKQIEKTDN